MVGGSGPAASLGEEVVGPLKSWALGAGEARQEWGGATPWACCGPGWAGLLGVPATWAPSCSGLYDWWQLVLVWIVWTVGMAASQALSPQPRKGRVLVAGGWAERLGCGVGAGRSASCRGPGLAGASRTGRRQMGAQGEA